MAECIEREAALEICEREYQERLRMLDYCGDTVAWNIGHAIKELPTADVAPVVHGRWEPCSDENGRWRQGFAKCSNCKKEYYAQVINRFEYCCNCGAKMDGGADHAAD